MTRKVVVTDLSVQLDEKEVCVVVVVVMMMMMMLMMMMMMVVIVIMIVMVLQAEALRRNADVSGGRGGMGLQEKETLQLTCIINVKPGDVCEHVSYRE